MIAKPTPRPKVRKPLKSRPHRVATLIREAVLDRDDFTCQWCKVPGGALDAHHKLARSVGGTDAVSNLVSLHRLCHMQVHANPTEARRRGLIIGAGSNQ